MDISLCLKWDHHYNALMTGLNDFFTDQEFVDCTICVDGYYFQAHKLVLSICSPYFKRIFETHQSHHPMVIIQDVKRFEFQNLLKFMYSGEVSVTTSNIFSFLKTAKFLEIKGLTEEKLNERISQTTQNVQDQSTESVSEEVKKSISDEEPSASGCAGITTTSTPEETVLPTYHLLDSDGEQVDFSQETQSDIHNYRLGAIPEIQPHQKVGGVKCPRCQRFFANRYNLKVHVRDKHDTKEGTLTCMICQKHMRNPSCLRVHMYHHRKQAASVAPIKTETSTSPQSDYPLSS